MVNQQDLVRKQQADALKHQKEMQSRMLKQKALQFHTLAHNPKKGRLIFVLIILAILAVILFVYQPWKYFIK